MATVVESPKGRFLIEVDDVEMSLIRIQSAREADKRLSEDERKTLHRMNEDFAAVRPLAGVSTER